MVPRIMLLSSLACVAFSSLLYSQADKKAHPNSPVFKNYQPPTTAPLLEQSDVTYQLWQGFRVQRQANAGDAVSQFELSIRYLTGRGFKADTIKAAYWTKKSAEQNHLLARYNLAIFQFNGWGTEWNPFDAYRNFRYVAERNIPEAQYVLAQFLTENLVVPKNWDEAYRWVKLAADSGYVPAKETLKEFEKRGYHVPGDSSTSPLSTTNTSQQPQNSSVIQLTFINFSSDTVKAPSDSVLLDDALKAAVLSQNKEVQRIFGSMNISAEQLEVDSSALRHLMHSAEAGSPEALTLLGRCYERGVRMERDRILAAMNYVRAIRFDSPRAGRMLYDLLQEKRFFDDLRHRVNQNDADAMYVWACLVALGFDRQLTDAQALQMLERAVALHHPQAMIELGLCCYAGRWIKRNERKAEELWRQAATAGSTEANIRLAIGKIRGKKKDFALAIPIVKQAAREGSVLAEFALAYCYETGSGLARNKSDAVRLYRNSGQRGSQDALRALERMYDEIRPKETQFQILN